MSLVDFDALFNLSNIWVILCAVRCQRVVEEAQWDWQCCLCKKKPSTHSSGPSMVFAALCTAIKLAKQLVQNVSTHLFLVSSAGGRGKRLWKAQEPA